MNNVYGVIYAYHVHMDLGELGKHRTAAALPIFGRYRLIDFSLSALMNAGILDLDVIMQYGYQSLMDHLRGGRTWNMARHTGGMHMRLASATQGRYGGSMDALAGIEDRLQNEIKDEYILLTRGDLSASLDMSAFVEAHIASGADVTAFCTARPMPGAHNRFLVGEDGFATELRCRQTEQTAGVASLETYILKREALLEMIRWCSEGSRLHFHGDGLMHMMRSEGWRVNTFLHDGYARFITNIEEYYEANMDMLDPENLAALFPEDRPVVARSRSDVSTYYSDTARVSNSLVADGCLIEGDVERCILFPGVRIEPGARLRDCILLNDTVVRAGSDLKHVIADKGVSFAAGLSLAGSGRLPLVVPKGGQL